MLLLSVLVHQGEPGDSVLCDWIKDHIDSILGVGPGVIVVGLGLVVGYPTCHHDCFHDAADAAPARVAGDHRQEENRLGAM